MTVGPGGQHPGMDVPELLRRLADELDGDDLTVDVTDEVEPAPDGVPRRRVTTVRITGPRDRVFGAGP